MTICNPCPTPECSHPHCREETAAKLNVAALAPGRCPSCSHPQHVGEVCKHSEVVGTDPLYQVTTLCGCTPEAAIKQAKGKARGFRLLPWDALAEIAGVYEYGIKKGYLADSWRNVKIDEYEEAMFRHWSKHKQGELIDPESGLRHVAHFVWNGIAVLALSRA